MNWEAVNGVTGIISAICAVVSISYLGTHSKQKIKSRAKNILSLERIMTFMMVCSGWALCCLSFLWVIEPYGSYVSDEDYQNFFGVVLALPAFIIFVYGVGLLKGEDNDNEI